MSSELAGASVVWPNGSSCSSIVVGSSSSSSSSSPRTQDGSGIARNSPARVDSPFDPSLVDCVEVNITIGRCAGEFRAWRPENRSGRLDAKPDLNFTPLLYNPKGAFFR